MASQHVAVDYERLENHCNIFSIPSYGMNDYSQILGCSPPPLPIFQGKNPGNEVEGSEEGRGAKNLDCYTTTTEK